MADLLPWFFWVAVVILAFMAAALLAEEFRDCRCRERRLKFEDRRRREHRHPLIGRPGRYDR